MENVEWMDAKATDDGVFVNGVLQPWEFTRVTTYDAMCEVCTSYAPENEGDTEESWLFTLESFPRPVVFSLPLEATLTLGRVDMLRFKHGYVFDESEGWELPRQIVDFMRGPRQSAPDDIELPWEVEEDEA